MARPIVLSNGGLHVGLNNFGLVHDLFFPYVGLENHTAGANGALRHKIGVYIDGKISWLDDDKNWQFTFSYPHDSLIGHTVVTNQRIGITLEFDDAVDSELDIFMRNIHVINLKNEKREIRLFLHQAFDIGDAKSATDTAQYLPDSDALLHYNGQRVFVVSARMGEQVFDQFAIGLYGIEGHEGTFRDAEDGELVGTPVEHGRVDSVLRFKFDLGAHSSARVHYWLTAGLSIHEALGLHRTISETDIDKRLEKTARWWQKWTSSAVNLATDLPAGHRTAFINSAMILKSQIDKRGAAIASTDTSLLNYSRDGYSYCWPRDGAYVIWSLIRIGYYDEAYNFFNFIKRVLHPGGYVMHKYRADGALGSSWHPYLQHNGDIAPPIQTDETASVVYVFTQFFARHPNKDLLKEFYHSMIKPMADFLAGYIDEETGLPKASYDLWEEVYETTTYTTAVTYAALTAVSALAEQAEDDHSAIHWQTAADNIQTAAKKHLYNSERGAFYKGVVRVDGQLKYDETIDSSAVFGASMFGLFEPDDHEMLSSVSVLKDAYGVIDTRTGLPRYENDSYRRENKGDLGNWWYVTTLWLVQYDLNAGRRDEAMERLEWLMSTAGSNVTLGEQIDPVTRKLISPAPLAWSHAQYLLTWMDYIEAEK